ncbi:MAG: hypothetical protein ACRD8Z_15630 [Nitrososphaeraceae archaeon]
MTRLASSEEYRICANCPNGTPMRKLPYLNGVWMCVTCSGFEYRLPEEWKMPVEQEDKDQTLYQEENNGE